MKASAVRRIGALGATAAVVGAIGATAVGASATDTGRQADVATITMELEGKRTFFEGPKSVDAGSDLAIVNNSDPAAIGPHTFTLIEKSELPGSKQEIKDCFKFKSELCLKIVKDHKVDLKTGEIGRPDLDFGKKGWDASYGKKGDSWATAEEGEETDRIVSAKPGSKLYYFCLVHPDMQGKLKVK